MTPETGDGFSFFLSLASGDASSSSFHDFDANVNKQTNERTSKRDLGPLNWFELLGLFFYRPI